MKKFIKNFFRKIGYILLTIITGGLYGILPAGVMYAAHQTTAGYIKKYEAGSSKLETALKMTNYVDIVCGIILGVIAIWIIIEIIKCIIGKVDLDKFYEKTSSSGYNGDYSSSNSSNSSNGKIRVETDIFVDRIYKDSSGRSIARGETNIFGEEIIKKL